jgi:protein-S-isoprenylcysteine O-methyltransferase Ste14
MNRLFVRAALAFLALPGTVAFLIPWLLAQPVQWASFTHPLAWGTLVAGLVVLGACVREFYVAGRGTLAPWAPPRSLVVTGLYRYSRNPMYIGVLLILASWAIGFASWRLTLYAASISVLFQVRVRLHEEPFAARTFGEAWTAYRARVPRWLGVSK